MRLNRKHILDRDTAQITFGSLRIILARLGVTWGRVYKNSPWTNKLVRIEGLNRRKFNLVCSAFPEFEFWSTESFETIYVAVRDANRS